MIQIWIPVMNEPLSKRKCSHIQFHSQGWPITWNWFKLWLAKGTYQRNWGNLPPKLMLPCISQPSCYITWLFSVYDKHISRYTTVQYITFLHTAQQSQIEKFDQTVNSRRHPHISPLDGKLKETPHISHLDCKLKKTPPYLALKL